MTHRPWDRAAVDLPTPAIPLESSFEGFLNLEWIALTDDVGHVAFEVRDDLKQPLGLLHGGIYSCVAETVASVATVAAVWRDGFTGSGMSNVASFLRPVTSGRLEAICRRRSRDADRWIWSADFIDEQHRLCAIVEVTVAVRRAAATG